MSLPITCLRGLGAFAVLGGVWLFVGAAPVDPEAKSEPPAEKIRKALDKTITLKSDNQSLSQAISQLREQTKINIVLDRITLAPMGIDTEGVPVSVDLEKVKLRTALQVMLSEYNLGYAIVGGMLLITAENQVVQRQMQQRVSVNFDKVPLKTALQQLGRETAVNLLLDARAAKEGQNAVSLHLDDVPLELTVRLLAEMADLKLVRADNVLIVTDEARADRLRAELAADQNVAGQPFGQFNPAMQRQRGGRMAGPGAGNFGGFAPVQPPAMEKMPPMPGRQGKDKAPAPPRKDKG